MTRFLSSEPPGVSSVVRRFAHGLRQMAKLRGWRLRDRLILGATIIIQLAVAPIRLTLLLSRPLFAATRLESKWMEWRTRLGSVDYSVPFSCVIVSGDGLLKMRPHAGDLWFAFEDFEKLVRELFIAAEGEVVVDVGAYIGLYTIRASRLVGSQGKVIAIEADPSNFEALLFNLELNQANNVIPLNLAAWDKEAMLDLHIFQEHLAHHSLTHLHGSSAKSIKVKARPLDAVLEELGIEKVDWVKIDVEGAEVEVLQGMEKTVSRSPNLRLLVELHSGEITEKCLSLLKGKGYEIRQIDHDHILAVPQEVD